MSISLPSRLKPTRRESSAVPRSQVERLWLIGGSLAALVLVLIGYFFFIGPQRSQTSDVRTQVGTAEQQDTALEARIAALRQQNVNLPRYENELAQARLALPAASGVSDFVRSLQTLGNATLTNVTSVSVGQPAPVTAPAATPTAGATPSSTAPTPATTAAPAPPSVYSLSITATVSGNAPALDRFLEQLQSVQPRAVLIEQIAETAGPSAATTVGAGAKGNTTLQLTMLAFIAPGDQVAPATPGK